MVVSPQGALEFGGDGGAMTDGGAEVKLRTRQDKTGESEESMELAIPDFWKLKL